MTAHTPGPWQVHNNPAHTGLTIVSTNLEISKLPALVGYTNGCNWPDANLIAAAPEMLAALIASESMMNVSEPTMWCDEDQEIYRDVVAVIAKATGESQ